MRGVLINIYVVLVIIASSYLTLGIFEPDTAARYWGLYAVITFILSVLGIICNYRKQQIEWLRHHKNRT
jgi:hypothetical protein